MMAISFSEEDFQCLQNQLLELRTKVYGLEETKNKYQNELKQAHLYEEGLRCELSKIQKTIQRSKNAREFEQLLQENKRLQGKLQSQEDEFRLQNETLMQEVVHLTTTTTELQKELELVKSVDNVVDKEINDGILRLKAENLALKKLQKSDSTEKDNENEKFNFKLEREIGIEENALLKKKLQDIQTFHKEELLELQNEVEKLTEKLKKKQKSMTQLHDEKEKMYTEYQATLKDIEAKNSEETQKLQKHIQQLKQEIHKSVGDDGDSKKFEQSFDEPEAKVEFISGETASFEYSLNDTKQRIREYEKQVFDLNQQLETLQSTIEKVGGERVQLLQQNQVLIEEKEKLNATVKEITDLAEKRRIHMEEMNKHILENTNKHSKEIDHLTEQLAKEQEEFKKIFEKEKETRIELIERQNEVNRLRLEMERLKKDHTVSAKDVADLRETLAETKESFENQLEELKTKHQKFIEELEEQLKSELNNLNIQLEVTKAEKTEFEDKVHNLEQEVKDLNDEKKIIEKKNLSMIKDLKRQLHSEQKRADKLQERLQETLNEQNRSVEEILQSSNASDKPKGDVSSVSSWSYVSAENADRENTLHSDGSSCGRDSPNQQSPSTLENETTSLLKKVAHLQQKSWIFEEKVNHLEESNEALVDDLLKKTAIIQFYCMEGRSNAHSAAGQDKLTIKRIVDFIKDKGDENLREINRKMQRMLEETLTKNMHLQKDIETLSNEVSRLSKAIETSEDQNMQSTVFIDGI